MVLLRCVFDCFRSAKSVSCHHVAALDWTRRISAGAAKSCLLVNSAAVESGLPGASFKRLEEAVYASEAIETCDVA